MSDDPAQDYIDAIPAEHRPLFDRVEVLVFEVQPDAVREFSYKLPTYRVGKRRLYVGSWAHGISLYGWQADHDGGFSERHPELRSGKGTLRLSHEAAAAIDDDELRDFLRAGFAAT
jgi:uncharacterized protein YdhG (YjbR/CyaY superfamily)